MVCFSCAPQLSPEEVFTLPLLHYQPLPPGPLATLPFRQELLIHILSLLNSGGGKIFLGIVDFRPDGYPQRNFQGCKEAVDLIRKRISPQAFEVELRQVQAPTPDRKTYLYVVRVQPLQRLLFCVQRSLTLKVGKSQQRRLVLQSYCRDKDGLKQMTPAQILNGLEQQPQQKPAWDCKCVERQQMLLKLSEEKPSKSKKKDKQKYYSKSSTVEWLAIHQCSEEVVQKLKKSWTGELTWWQGNNSALVEYDVHLSELVNDYKNDAKGAHRGLKFVRPSVKLKIESDGRIGRRDMEDIIEFAEQQNKKSHIRLFINQESIMLKADSVANAVRLFRQLNEYLKRSPRLKLQFSN